MWTFGRKIAAGFTLAFVLLVVVGLSAYRGVVSLTETSYLVAHSQQVLDRLATTFSLLKDAETGQRGFVITGDESFLEPYQHAVETMGPTLAELRSLSADMPAAKSLLEQAEPIVAAKLAELKHTI